MPPRHSEAFSRGAGIGGFIRGFIKTALTGGVIGGLLGGLIAGAAMLVGGAPLALAGIGASALAGGAIGAAILAPIGALSGMVTGIVRSREANQPTAQDIINVANISLAQGINVGRHIERDMPKTRFAAKYKEEKILMAEQQREH